MGRGGGPVPPQHDLTPELGSLTRKSGTDQDTGHWGTEDPTSALERGPSHEEWGGGPGWARYSEVSSWMDRQGDSGGAERGSLHVRIAPIPQRFVGLLDDLG